MNSAQRLPIIEAVDISKHYGSRIALDRVRFAVKPGEIVGLLGPNGAGKTTTLSILSGSLRPDSGQVLFNRRANGDQSEAQQLLGLVPQSLALYPTLTPAQNIMHFARMQGLSHDDARRRCIEVLTDIGLASRAADPVESLSGGMKRRLNLACAVAHRPAVLLLDEATVGIDMESREQILALVRQVAAGGTAVIYSTHYMEEAERICDRVLLIDRGKLIADGTVDELIAVAGNRCRMELTLRGKLPGDWLKQLPAVEEVASSVGEGKVTLELRTMAQVGEILEKLRVIGIHVLDFSLHSPNLADAFLALTGRALRDSSPDAS